MDNERRLRVRAWFADSWYTLVPAAILAVFPAPYVGLIVGSIVCLICSSIDLDFFVSIWIGTVLSYVAITCVLWEAFDAVRNRLRTSRRTQPPTPLRS